VSKILSERDLIDQLQALFRVPVEIHSSPGGVDRKTVICRIGDDLRAVSQRKPPVRATLEATILQKLGQHGLSPKLVLHEGALVVQEYVAGRRLAEHLDTAQPDDAERLMGEAARSILQVQHIAARAGLSARVPAIGIRPGWEDDMAAAPAHLAPLLGLPVPSCDFGALLRVAPGQNRVFVKWDARPGNAIVRDTGQMCWIDWEHAGARRPVDDLVWLFGDEWAADAPNALDRALRLLSRRQGVDQSDLRLVFCASAVAHSALRLSLIYSRKGGGPWWNRAACLQHDRVGVTAEHVRRVAARAADWAEAVPGLRRLCGFFQTIAANA